MSAVVVYIIAVSFVATVIRSTFGFGESLVAVPLLALVMPVSVAVPLGVAISIVVALVVVIQDHRAIHFASARALIASAACGVPLGLAVLVYGNETLIKIALGGVIVAYSAYSLVARSRYTLDRDDRRWLLTCGFVSGVMGGAYGLNGPPLVLYGNLRRWEPPQFRATLQAYFLPISALGFAGYAAQGLVTATLARSFAECLPAVLPAIFVGRYLNRRLDGRGFYRFVYAGLIAIGGVLIGFAAR